MEAKSGNKSTKIFQIMAEQRGGEMRNKKSLELTDADEGVQKIDNSNDDGRGGLFTAEYFKQLNSGLDTHAPVDLNVDAFDGGDNFSANASGEDAQMISDFLKSILVDDDDGGIETEKKVSTFTRSSDDFVSGEKSDDIVKTEDTNGSDGFVAQGAAPRRIRYQSVCVNEDSDNQEFGRDTNRLDYFSVTAFDVYENDHLTGVASYGGGGGRRDRGVVLAPRLEQERGGATDVAGGGIRIQRDPVGISANNDGETVVQRLEQERGDGGRRGRRLMVGTRLEQERGSDSATAGAGGGDRTREAPDRIFGNNGSDGGEAIAKRLKHERATVAVPVVVVLVVAVMIMVMVIVMVVLVSVVMVKKEVWW